jgi:acetyl/propionyl-CoA carboxylase alpha subunit
MTRIEKLLIANRGEIATRIMRTAREMAIATVAVYSDPDEGAPFARQADEAVRLPGSTPADTYLRSDLILAAARATGADAIHPGYGFLSENGSFARACEEAGVVFVGPPASAIDAMASKIEAKLMMAQAGVPVLPGFVIEEGTDSGRLAQQAQQVGFPVMVKAAFGGGGRGMRVVGAADQLVESVAQAQREAASAFGDGTVFLERFVEAPRHVEVQIFGDRHGRVVHLFERECSIQRRHQKIVEEAPSPAVDGALRELLGQTAVAAAKAIGYVGAGTVEFVLDQHGDFYFLEVNTRLQVEHPVTEMVTGLDLVRLQLEVAAGKPLSDQVTEAALHGHAIEARLYAEDVPGGFLPTSGRLGRFRIPGSGSVRVDAGYEAGSVVSTFYDAMLAKVIAWAPDREEAIDRLSDALTHSTIEGLITNRALLVRTLRSDDFRRGQTDTAFLERHDPEVLGRPLYLADAPVLHAHAAAAHKIATGAGAGPAPATVPSGWRNVGGGTASLNFELDGRRITVPGRIQEFDGISLAGIDGDSVSMVSDGVRRRYRVERSGPMWYVESPLGATALEEIERFPTPGSLVAEGSLVAPMPGTVVSVSAGVGESVTAGQVMVTIEAMKMEHSLRAPGSGTVSEVRVRPGDQVASGSILVVVDEHEGSSSHE